jgi:uncharacterized protein (DUF1800 family)
MQRNLSALPNSDLYLSLKRLVTTALLLLSIVATNAYATALTDTQAKRFLTRATFGPVKTDIEQLQSLGYEQWVDQQLATPRQQKLLNRTIEIALMAEPNADWFSASGFLGEQSSPVWIYQNSAWWQVSLTAPDQLRQRVAFALSEVLVVSTAAEPYLRNRAEGVAAYYDLLLDHAFGNYRELLSAVTYSPAMGVFLSHHGNRKANPKRGTAPDENYARELMQLFSIGLYQLNPDGSPKYDANQELIPVYTQQDVMELARVFTGWDMVGNKRYGLRSNEGGNLTVPMEFNEQFHDFGSKTLLGKTIPADLSGKDDVEAALDIIFAQPEVGPFVCKQLIQRLVSSNPSSEYLQRVTKVFNDNGEGVRGDLGAVTKAILLDPEALSTESVKKYKEPILVTTAMLRALNVKPGNDWQTPKGGDMHGVYWFKKLDIGQDPLMAPSVFNYYEPDFQPVGEGFESTQNVAPEAQIIDSQLIIGFSNLVVELLNRSANPDRFAKKAWYSKSHISLDTQDYIKWLYANKWPADKANAVKALVQLLENDLLTEPLTSAERELLEAYLAKTIYNNDEKEAQRIVNDAIRLLVTMPSNWVQH